MKATEIIRKIVLGKGMKYSELAYRLQIGQNVLNERLRQKNISVDKLNAMLQVLGYKIVVMPYNAPVKDEWFEINEEE